jgi:hypothetical protein
VRCVKIVQDHLSSYISQTGILDFSDPTRRGKSHILWRCDFSTIHTRRRYKIVSFIVFFSFIIFSQAALSVACPHLSFSSHISDYFFFILFLFSVPLFLFFSCAVIFFFSVSSFLSSFYFFLVVLLPLDIYYFVVFPIPCVVYFTSLSYLTGFEVLIAAITKNSIFWGKTPCSPLKVNRRFGGTCLLHLQGRRINRGRKQLESKQSNRHAELQRRIAVFQPVIKPSTF